MGSHCSRNQSDCMQQSVRMSSIDSVRTMRKKRSIQSIMKDLKEVPFSVGQNNDPDPDDIDTRWWENDYKKW